MYIRWKKAEDLSQKAKVLCFCKFVYWSRHLY